MTDDGEAGVPRRRAGRGVAPSPGHHRVSAEERDYILGVFEKYEDVRRRYGLLLGDDDGLTPAEIDEVRELLAWWRKFKATGQVKDLKEVLEWWTSLKGFKKISSKATMVIWRGGFAAASVAALLLIWKAGAAPAWLTALLGGFK